MPKPLYSHALDFALRVVGEKSPARSNGGYGEVPLKTAIRLADKGWVSADPSVGARNTRLRLTPDGYDAFVKLIDHERDSRA